MSLRLRLHPLGSSEIALERQWASVSGPRDVRQPLIVVLRTVVEDPVGVADVGPLRLHGPRVTAALEAAWADAQLVADMTWLGLAVGVRIALVPESGRWFADTLVIRTGARLRTGRGNQNPAAALLAIRRSYAATLGQSASDLDLSQRVPLRLVSSTTAEAEPRTDAVTSRLPRRDPRPTAAR